MWTDKMTRKQLAAGQSYVATGTEIIKVFSAINGNSATIKLKSVNGDDYVASGNYESGSNFASLLPGERHEGQYRAASCGSGIVELFISDIVASI